MNEPAKKLETAADPPSKGMLWAGRVISALPVLMLLFSSMMKLSGEAKMLEMFTGKFGYPESTHIPIGIVELVSALLYAFPRTAVLGAILITGYLGGAIATHVRVGDPFLIPVFLATLPWVGLYLRDARIKALLPLHA